MNANAIPAVVGNALGTATKSLEKNLESWDGSEHRVTSESCTPWEQREYSERYQIRDSVTKEAGVEIPGLSVSG